MISTSLLEDWNQEYYTIFSQPHNILLFKFKFCSDFSDPCTYASAVESPECTLQNGRTALHFAAESGKTETVKLLLDHNADIDAVDQVCTIST